ncbi:MAG: nucleotide exchange factor GrpE [Clostridia bacterium]|nr:nucleotide exchange factor GrpE [Clostridia bacterium]
MTKKESTDNKIETREESIDFVAEETDSIDKDEFAQQQLSIAQKEADEYKNLAQRVQAEFDNYRKRNLESTKIAREDGKEDVLMALLPVLDNFERGLNIVEESARAGVELIYKQTLAILEKFEVKEIEALGQEFDPKYHHAIAQCEDPDQANIVVEVFQKGYIRKNKVLRPSLVKVAQ